MVKLTGEVLKTIAEGVIADYKAVLHQNIDGSWEGTMPLSGIQIKAKQIKRKRTKYIEITTTFMIKGKPIVELGTCSISGDGTYTIACNESFMAQIYVKLNT